MSLLTRELLQAHVHRDCGKFDISDEPTTIEPKSGRLDHLGPSTFLPAEDVLAVSVNLRNVVILCDS